MKRVGIQGYAVPAELRKNVSLTFVIDVSGSMDMQDRLGLVKESLELLLEQLRPTDQVSIVVYGSDARAILEPTTGDRIETIMNAIRALRAEGSTNAEAGLYLGYQMAMQAFNPEGINRVILCSDGVANVGNIGAGSIWESVKGYASEGITLTTVGFGMGNYNDVLMEQFAEILRESYWAQDSSLAGLLEDVERVSSLLDEDADIIEFVEMVRRASQLAIEP